MDAYELAREAEEEEMVDIREIGEQLKETLDQNAEQREIEREAISALIEKITSRKNGGSLLIDTLKKTLGEAKIQTTLRALDSERQKELLFSFFQIAVRNAVEQRLGKAGNPLHPDDESEEEEALKNVTNELIAKHPLF